MKLLNRAVLTFFVVLAGILALGTGLAAAPAGVSRGLFSFAAFPRKHHKKKDAKKTKKPKNAKVESLPKQ